MRIGGWGQNNYWSSTWYNSNHLLFFTEWILFCWIWRLQGCRWCMLWNEWTWSSWGKVLKLKNRFITYIAYVICNYDVMKSSVLSFLPIWMLWLLIWHEKLILSNLHFALYFLWKQNNKYLDGTDLHKISTYRLIIEVLVALLLLSNNVELLYFISKKKLFFFFFWFLMTLNILPEF